MYEIPATDPWKFVDEKYEEASDTMFDEWEENLRRWRG